MARRPLIAANGCAGVKCHNNLRILLCKLMLQSCAFWEELDQISLCKSPWCKSILLSVFHVHDDYSLLCHRAPQQIKGPYGSPYRYLCGLEIVSSVLALTNWGGLNDRLFYSWHAILILTCNFLSVCDILKYKICGKILTVVPSWNMLFLVNGRRLLR